MAKTSETGYAKNVSNFESLLTSITAFGSSYNPSKDSIKRPALELLLTSAKDAYSEVNTLHSSYSITVDTRETAFEPLSKLITRVNNALKASDSTMQMDESAQTIIRKLQGRRAVAKLTEEEKKALAEAEKEVNQISASQMSYDNRLDNLDKLIALLTTVTQYNPNEEDLKVETLKTLYNDLKLKNSDVVSVYVQLDNARNIRNEILFKPLSGMLDIVYDVKKYIKSAFGATSPQYKQVSKLQFVTRK